ncbi:MAG TPA: polynucleotide adenylyltransferase PcnB [Planctomycetota bacterium]
MPSGTGPTKHDIPFARRRLQPRAVDVVTRLQEAGFEAYMVGGCVRDLLLGRLPKDFDVATSARPTQVRRLFRRSRIIGRRFKIVHVYSGREIYEVATFRGVPDGHDEDSAELIVDDNTFGTSEEDAVRRDFTVNGLFLDPVAGKIIDWVGGMDDIKARRLRSIGDPEQRFREDPVRILRLIKFMRRLQLEPGSAEIDAANKLVGHLSKAAAPRVVEEVFRLMLTGDMEGVLEDLIALDALRRALPDLAGWLAANPRGVDNLAARMRVLDEWVREGGEPCYSLRLAVLYGIMAEAEMDSATASVQDRDPAQALFEVFAVLQARARLPRWALSRAKTLVKAQQQLDPPAARGSKRRRRRMDPEALIYQEWFPDALEYLRCRLEAAGRDLSPYDEWHERALSLAPEGR